ncbi:unnamed protein product, partial [marine sediment metagenome]
PSCKINHWLILSRVDDNAKMRCLNCSKEYEVTFDKMRINPLIEKLDFVYVGKVTCYQCNKSIPYSGVSSVRKRTFKCKNCGLEFSYNLVDNEKYKKIIKIKEIEAKKSSEKGGTKMKEDEKKVEKAEINKDVIDETKVEEQPEVKTEKEVQEAPKIEEKVEAKEEKTVDIPVEEKVEVKDEKVETSKEEKTEVEVEKVEAPKEEKVEEKTEELSTKEVEDEKVETKKVDDEKLVTAQLIKKYTAGIRKLAKKYKEMKKSMLERVEFY